MWNYIPIQKKLPFYLKTKQNVLSWFCSFQSKGALREFLYDIGAKDLKEASTCLGVKHAEIFFKGVIYLNPFATQDLGIGLIWSTLVMFVSIMHQLKLIYSDQL